MKGSPRPLKRFKHIDRLAASRVTAIDASHLILNFRNGATTTAAVLAIAG